MRSLILLIILCFVTGIFSYLSIFLIKEWAIKFKIIAHPNKRSSHIKPTPVGGGVVIFTMTTAIIIFVWMLKAIWPKWWLLWNDKTFFFFLISSFTVVLISLIDDLYTLTAIMKFIFQCIAAIIAIWVFGYFEIIKLPFMRNISFGVLGIPLTFLWIVGLTNAYNFMDGIDGIAASQGVIAGIGWSVIGALYGMPLVCGLGGIIAASCLGFLMHNWPPATIFMGDVGSIFLGYIFAVMPVIALHTKTKPWAFFFGLHELLIGILLVWPFLFDATFTFLRRLAKGENVFKAHRSHLYQRLVIAGLSHKTVTMIYIGLDLLGLVLAIFLLKNALWVDFMVIVLLFGAFIGLWRFTVLKEKTAL